VVVVGFRILGWAWMMLLVILTLAADDAADRSIVIGAAVLGTVWAGVTVFVGWRTNELGSWWFVLADGAVVLAIGAASTVSGATDLFHGGYLISWVVLAAYAGGLTGALAASVALTIEQVVVHVVDGRGLIPTGGSVVFFVFAVVVGWAFDALRRYDRERREAEAELEALNAGLQQMVEEKVTELERANRLRRYVSPQLADSILAGDTEVDLGSSRKYLTIFMADIRGFTAIAERMEPESLVEELNEYLSEITDIIFRYGGTLDKYIGDAVLVFFGDPVPQDDQEQRAVEMALEIQDRVDEFADRWQASYGESFRIGIGIATGWVTVGNIGSSARTDYTVLGNEVNLASRLADRAAPGEILISDRTMIKAQAATGRVVDEVTLAGVSRPIKVYSLERVGSPH
jgi:class 3 adenylate cyclase